MFPAFTYRGLENSDIAERLTDRIEANHPALIRLPAPPPRAYKRTKSEEIEARHEILQIVTLHLSHDFNVLFPGSGPTGCIDTIVGTCATPGELYRQDYGFPRQADLGDSGASSSTGAVWGVEGEQFSSDPGAVGVLGRGHIGGVGVTGLNDAAGGIGVRGSAPAGFGFVTDSNVQQARTMGGWVKAMVYYSGFNSGAIVNCFNSTLVPQHVADGFT